MRCCSSSLAAAGVRGLHLDLGHVGIYRALARAAGLDGTARATTPSSSSRCATRMCPPCTSSPPRCRRARARRAARARRRCTARPTKCSPPRARRCRRLRRRSRAALDALEILAATRGRRRCAARRPGGPARLSLLHRRELLGIRARRARRGAGLRPRRPLRRRRPGLRPRPSGHRVFDGPAPPRRAGRRRRCVDERRARARHGAGAASASCARAANA